jgi:hypothetical protein
MVACKPPQKPTDSSALTASSSPQKNNEIICSVDASQESLKRLLSFKHRGVKPYLGCPFYRSEWSVYPRMKFNENSKEFENWMKSQFLSLERLSTVAGGDYFTDRYEFYTIVMGEGLPFLFDWLSEVDSDVSKLFNDKLEERRRKYVESKSRAELKAFFLGVEADLQQVVESSKKSAINLEKMRAEQNVVIPDSWQSRLLKIDPRKLPVNGFGMLGTDWFGDEFKKLQIRKYSKPYVGQFELGRDFETFKIPNELGETVNTPIFKDLQTGLKAFAAVYLERKNMFVEDARRILGSVPSDPEVRMYWTYYYYRRPAEALQKLRQSHGTIYVPAADEDGLRPQKIPLQCLKRVATRRFLAMERTLD